MSSRKAVYVSGVILAAVLFSIPQLLFFLNIGAHLFFKPIWRIPGFPMADRSMAFFEHRSQLQELQFWRDKFLHFVDLKNESGEIVARKIILIDPESGAIEEIESTYPGGAKFEIDVCGDELRLTRQVREATDNQVAWINETYEVVGQAFQQSNRHSLFGMGEYVKNAHQFIWDGQPAYLSQPNVRLADAASRSDSIVVSTRQNEMWQPVGQLPIPEVSGPWKWRGSPIKLTPESVEFEKNNGRPGVQIYRSEDTIHLFVHSGNQNNTRLFYHKGMKIAPLPSAVKQIEPPGPVVDASTAFAGTTDDNTEEWSLVREKPAIEYLGFGQTNGLLIEGKPVALIIDNELVKHPSGMTGRLYPTAQLYRLESEKWTEFASLSLPAGAVTFATFTTRDGQRSYLVSRSYLGESYVYALEASGFRETSGSASLKTRGYEWKNPAWEEYKMQWKTCGVILAVCLLLGMGLAACTSLLMRGFTSPVYEFGNRTVKLASLERRGTARLIDLALIIVLMVGLGGWLTRDFDWVSSFEVQELSIQHSSKEAARQTKVILLAGLFAINGSLVMIQARYGSTPGKWLCRLRTVQTTLRPVRFTQSLAREVLLIVDCCSFLYWVPGIVSMAFTDCRQRLGDLVADTIVIESQSLTEIPPTQ